MNPPVLKCSGNIPKVLWYQDDGRIVLRIMLIDVKKYFLTADLDHVRFSTIHGNKVYYLCLYLFGAILPGETVHENLGREIRIEFVKAHKFLDWLRLERSREKSPHIIPDPDRVEWEAEAPVIKHREWEDFDEYKRINQLNIYPDVPSTDEEESDDERYFTVTDRF